MGDGGIQRKEKGLWGNDTPSPQKNTRMPTVSSRLVHLAPSRRAALGRGGRPAKEGGGGCDLFNWIMEKIN